MLDAQGRATFYYIGPLYDGILSSGGQLRYLIDQGGGIDTRLADQVSVLDYASFQAAHDALPAAGGIILVPPGTYSKDTLPAFKGLVVTKPVAMIGVANGQARGLSVLLHDDPNGLDTDSIFLNVYGGCLLQNLYIWRPSAQAGAGRGVRWYKAGSPAPMVGLTLDNVTVENSPNWSFELLCDGYVTANTSSYISKLVMIDCTAFHAASGGSLSLGGAGSNNNFFTRCEFDGPGFGYYFNVNNCVVNLNATLVTLAGGSSFSAVAQGDEVAGMELLSARRCKRRPRPKSHSPSRQFRLLPRARRS